MKRTSRISSALTAMLLLAASLTACGETAKTPVETDGAPHQILPL